MIISVGSGVDNKVGASDIGRLLDEFKLAEQQSKTIVFKGSNSGRFFCAGFDLSVLVNCSESKVARVFTDFLLLSRAVFHSPSQVGVVCNGHAVGVGAILVLAADRSVMLSSAKLRFPEVHLGLGLFADMVDLLRYRLLPCRVEQFLREGRAFSGKEACQWGLVDEVRDTAVECSEVDFSGLPNVPTHAANQMKSLCRRGFLDDESVEAQVERFMLTWMQPDTQALIRGASGG